MMDSPMSGPEICYNPGMENLKKIMYGMTDFALMRRAPALF